MDRRQKVSRDLVEACWGRKWDEAAYILGGDEFDILWKDRESYTALHWAANHGDLSITLSLLHAGADPSVKNFMGNTALNLACSAKLLHIVQLLISFGSPLPLTKKDAGPLPKDTAEYDEFVVDYLQSAKRMTPEQRLKLRESIPDLAQVELSAQAILSGAFRKRKDEEKQAEEAREEEEEKEKEAKRLVEAKAHKERIVKLAARKAHMEAKAAKEKAEAKRAETVSLLMSFALPMLPLGMLWYLLYRALSAYRIVITVIFSAIGGMHAVKVWLDAPLKKLKTR